MTEKLMTAKYSGWCKACGGRIAAGVQIFWEQGNGARHAKCPDHAVAEQQPAMPTEPSVFVPPMLPDTGALVVKTCFRDGEYYSGWTVSTGSESLEKLGLGHYLSGWGWTLDDAVVKALGEQFTIGQAKAWAIPKLEAAFNAKVAAKAKKDADKAEKFEEARRTGQPVVIVRWSEDCDGTTDECDIDNIEVLAMPDGTTKKTRSHSW